MFSLYNITMVSSLAILAMGNITQSDLILVNTTLGNFTFLLLPLVIFPNVVRHWNMISSIWVRLLSDFTLGNLSLGYLTLGNLSQ